MPPPSPTPFVIVRPEMVTVLPALVVKIRNCDAAGSRFTASAFAPGPRICTLLLRFGNAPNEFGVIVPVTAKYIASSGPLAFAAVIASRRLQGLDGSHVL